MTANRLITLNGKTLKIGDINRLINDPGISVGLSLEALKLIDKSKKFTDKSHHDRIIYGVNTGFGPMASHIINRDQIVFLQENLIKGHAVGMGSSIDEKYILASMVVRLNTLARGYSGVSRDLIEQLILFINHRIIPVVPEHGAVGTSGDLVQLAHIAAALIAEGEVFYQGKKISASEVLKKLKIQPYKLGPKEGLALINGTSVMSGISALLCSRAEYLLSLSVRLGSMALELMHGYDDSISKKLHALRPHKGQGLVAGAMRSILSSSKMLRSRDDLQKKHEAPDHVYQISEEVQQVYSLRCIPQILGPALDTLEKTKKEVEIEINSVTDNPIVDWENKIFLHGGNFHGDYIAASIDQLKAALVKLTMLSERRINFFLDNKLNKTFPPFMNLKKPGLTLGLQGLQFVATSTTAQNQSYAFPHYIHSIPTNGGNQDVVSMGTDAALFAAKVIENAHIVLAIEWITLAQGIDFLNQKVKFSRSSRYLFDTLREAFPVIKDDRMIVSDLPRVVDLIKNNAGIYLDLNNG